MFQKANADGGGDPKSETNRLCPTSQGLTTNHNERITLPSNPKQQQYHDYFGNNPKEETKSHRSRSSKFHSLSQHSQHQVNTNQEIHHRNNNSNQINGQHMIRSTTNPQLNQIPPLQQAGFLPQPTLSPSFRSALKSESPVLASCRQPMRQRTSSISTIMGYSHPHDEHKVNSQQDQQRRNSDDVVTVIKEELENDSENDFKEPELETLGSLERNLPVELSFLIRQQAYCMAKMNYLDRQIRELKEVRQTSPIPSQQAASTSINQNTNRITTTTTNNTNATITNAHTKNGNFIPSDDSGGEYSRATISDDDELSSLLDQIAKSVRPERTVNHQNVSNNQQRVNYSVITNQPQQYAIINSNQLHHQAVPVFVMGSPIAMAHPSSISSNILPGVHFQPEPRYNQYYEDFYVQNNSSSSTLHRHNGIRSQQFDNSISAIEQLVSNKEKRQIKSQLRSADNWMKMRSSGLCNINDNFSKTNNGTNNGVTGNENGSVNERKLPMLSSSATIATGNSNSVIDEVDKIGF